MPVKQLKTEPKIFLQTKIPAEVLRDELCPVDMQIQHE
jgi:hypothetical protein